MRQQWEKILKHKTKTHTQVGHDFQFQKFLLSLRDLCFHTRMDPWTHFSFK